MPEGLRIILHGLQKIADWIDTLNERVGRFASWLVLAVVLLGAWNAVARYTSKFTGLDLASNAYLELQWYLFSAIFLLGLGYTLKRDEHVRVDVMHAAMKPGLIARIDIIGTIVFLIPFTLFALWASWFPVRNSWEIREMSPDPDGLARYPIKTLVPVAFVLLLLQGISMLIRRVEQMKRQDGRGQHPASNIQHSTFKVEVSNSSSIQNPSSSAKAMADKKSKIKNPDTGGVP